MAQRSVTNQNHIVAHHPLPAAGLLAMASLPVHALLPEHLSMQLAAGILALIGGVYIGFAALDGRLSRLALETAVAVLFAVYAMTALNLGPVWLAAGYMAHGLWDTAHHTPLFNVKMPRWYIPLCATYDIIAGVGMLLIWTIK